MGSGRRIWIPYIAAVRLGVSVVGWRVLRNWLLFLGAVSHLLGKQLPTAIGFLAAGRAMLEGDST